MAGVKPSVVNSTSASTKTCLKAMSTPILIGLGAIGAAVIGRQLMRSGARAGAELAKGGFKAKMDRAEAMDILGLKWVFQSHFHSGNFY